MDVRTMRSACCSGRINYSGWWMLDQCTQNTRGVRGGGVALESDKRSLLKTSRFYPKGPKKPESARKNVSGNIWGGSKVNFPHRTLNKISKFFC